MKSNEKNTGISCMYDIETRRSYGELTADKGDVDDLFGEDSSRLSVDKLYKNALVNQAVDVPVSDSIGNWIDIGGNVPLIKELKGVFMSSGIDARKYGSSMILPVIVKKDDGKRVSLKLSLYDIYEDLSEYELLRFVQVQKFKKSSELDDDITSRNFGKPKEYFIGEIPIHPSRVIMIFANNAGNSFIDSIKPYWEAFTSRYDDVTQAVSESNWIILKTDFDMLVGIAKSKIEMEGAGRVDDIVSDLLSNRLTELRFNANNNNAYGIDNKTEDIVLVSKSNIAQLDKASNSALELLTAAVDIPIGRFLGKQVSGLGTDGSSKVYMQSLTGLRSFMFDDVLDKTIEIISRFNNLGSVTWSWNLMSIEEFNLVENGAKEKKDVISDK